MLQKCQRVWRKVSSSRKCEKARKWERLSLERWRSFQTTTWFPSVRMKEGQFIQKMWKNTQMRETARTDDGHSNQNLLPKCWAFEGQSMHIQNKEKESKMRKASKYDGRKHAGEFIQKTWKNTQMRERRVLEITVIQTKIWFPYVEYLKVNPWIHTDQGERKHNEERKKQSKDNGDSKYAGRSSSQHEKHANERAHLVKVKAVPHRSRKHAEECKKQRMSTNGHIHMKNPKTLRHIGLME